MTDRFSDSRFSSRAELSKLVGSLELELSQGKGLWCSETHRKLGMCYQAQGAVAEAEEEYREALSLDDTDGVARYHLAGLLMVQNEDMEAQTLLREAHERFIVDFGEKHPFTRSCIMRLASLRNRAAAANDG